jgi:flagellar basal-body rod protein FlgB
MEASHVTNSLIKELSFRAKRQNIISSNIANIDTPNYKTKDIKFEDVLENSRNLTLKKTNSMHISVDKLPQEKISIYEVEGLESQNDGNNVDIDEQMSEMSKNNLLFRALKSSLQKDSRLLRTAIDSASKTN